MRYFSRSRVLSAKKTNRDNKSGQKENYWAKRDR